MKINQFSILPANVRYDRSLGDKSILLYAELMAASNAYGFCDDDTKYFAVALNVELRTIFRCLTQLEEQGHIQRVKENGKRRIKVILKTLEVPHGVEIETDELVPKADITEFVQQVITTWEKAVGTKVDKPDMYTERIAQRLGSFTKDEIMTALKNRATYINQSDWHKSPENMQLAVSIDAWLKSDQALLQWLNAKVKEDEKITLSPFKRK